MFSSKVAVSVLSVFLAGVLLLLAAPTCEAQTAAIPLDISAGFNMDSVLGPVEYRICLTDGSHEATELFGDRAEGNGNYVLKERYFIVANGYDSGLNYSIESTYGHPIYMSGDNGLPADGVLTGADRRYHVASLLGNPTLPGDWTETADPSDYSLKPNTLHVGSYHNNADWQIPSVTVELPAAQKAAYSDVNFVLAVHNGANLGRNMRIVALYGPDGADESVLYAFTTDAGGDGPVMTSATEPGFSTVAAMTQWYSGPTGATGLVRAGNSWLFEFDAPLTLDAGKQLWGFRFDDVNPSLNWAARGLTVFAATATRDDTGNVAPVADAGADMTIIDSDENGRENVRLDASASADADGDIVAYAWSEGGATVAVGVSPLVSMTVATHTLELTVTDATGATSVDTIIIDITPPPSGSPFAKAGGDKTYFDADDSGDETITLDGSASYDADGAITSWLWSENGAPIASGQTVDVTLSVGVHDITLLVTDNDGLTRDDSVTVTITAYRDPTTYYVDATGGSDANDGSETSPFKTIQFAASVASVGDTVIVLPGQYDEAVTVARSGAEGSMVSFRAEPAHQARVKGFVLQGDYISVEGFEITNTASGANGIFAGEAHRGTARTGCRMLNNYIHDIGGTAITTGRNALARDNLARNVFRGFMVNSNTLVENNEIDTLVAPLVIVNGVERPEKTQYAFFAGDYITFRGNYFHGAPMELMAKWGVDFVTTWDAWIYGSSRHILVENNRFFNATHGSEPSGTALRDSYDITFRNNLFVETVFVGVYCTQFSEITIVNNTFINCGAYPVWFQGSREPIGSTVRNNLFAYWNHTPVEGGYPGESGVRIDTTLKPDCDYNMFWGCLNRGYGANDFTAEPEFVDPANNDFRLKATSPGVDAGSDILAPAFDMLGVARPVGAAIDIGAYEIAGGGPGDANGDGSVDIQDFVILKQNYGKSPAARSEGDFNDDGAVDIQDFVILKQNYGS